MPAQPLTDDDLFALYQAGDSDAFDMLFDRFRKPVYHYVRSLLPCDSDAEEVLQDTFIAVAKATGYEARGKLKSWIYQIARNRSLNRLRTLRTRAAILAKCEFCVVDAPDPASGPDRNSANRDEHAYVRAALEELPLAQRDALVLFAYEGLRYEDIAAIHGCPINTVKTHIRRARISLAKALAAVNSGDSR